MSIATGASFLALAYMGVPLNTIPQVMFASIDSFPLLAIPFFLLCGTLMTAGGPSRYLVAFFDSLVGHFPGGLGIVTVLSCMFFASISGSSPATAIAVGSVMVPSMVELGYDKKFAMGLACASGTLGILIPPSIPMIMYGSITELSIPRIFLAGFIPGILLGGILITTAVVISIKNKYGGHARHTWAERWMALKKALPALGMPLLILGGIYGGIFTPTEAAAVSCIYAYLVGRFIYRELNRQKFLGALKETAQTTAMIFLIICSAILLGRVLTFAQIPQKFAGIVTAAKLSPYLFLLGVNVIYLIMGCLFETVTIIYVTVPIFYPVLLLLGIDPIHFAIILIVNIELALITPPIGINLYIITGVCKEPIEKVVKGVVPFTITMIMGLFIITYCPRVSLYLDKIFYR
jgi:C4-dicarboxylate transporter DctM subunit